MVWSEHGHTPLTKRGSYYCDELLRTKVKVESPKDARKKCVELINTTTHAVYGFWHAPKMAEGPISGFENGGFIGCEWRKKLAK